MRINISRCLLMATAVLGLSTVAGAGNPPNYPTKAIELKYYAQGSAAVTSDAGFGCCDSSGNKFDVYYPTNLGANGFMHPIITWGNGTSAKPSQYAYFLNHLASWGFVVVATEDENAGVGQTILDAANFMIAQNSTPSSIFYNKLNVSEIGAAGHSQGATGAVNALIKSAGSIKTVIPIELPARIWCSSKTNCTDTKNITAGSIFLIDGSEDTLISPPTQPGWESGEQSIAAYYNAAPGKVDKQKGTLIGPNHNDVQGQPSCSGASYPCTNGVYGYLGYPTAWLMWQLQGDSYAAGAFGNSSGEIYSETTNWKYVGSNIR